MNWIYRKKKKINNNNNGITFKTIVYEELSENMRQSESKTDGTE